MFPKIDKRAIEAQIAARLAVIMREETDDAFRIKSWDGTPWQPVKNMVPQGSLMLRTALLRRSLTFRASGNTVRVSSAVPYASLHNEGGTVSVPVTERMRRYFFYMYKLTKNERFLAMALSRKQSFSMRIPRRQFTGIQKSTRIRIQKIIGH